MNSDRVEGALRELEAEDRALIELSVVRGVSDDEIASLLNTDTARVRSRRAAAIGDLAAAVGDPSEEGRAATVDQLKGSGRAAGSAAAAEAAAPQRSRLTTLALLGGLAIALVVALVLALSGGNDEDASSAGEGVSARLLPIGGGPTRGSVQVVGSGDSARLRLKVRGLPDPPKGGYVVWLYNSISDARSLGGQLRGSFSLDTPLPKDWSRYQAIDISREPADGNRNHSGQSVVRAPLGPLAQ